MEQIKRRLWISDNGKYKVLVRHSLGELAPWIDCWELKRDRYIYIRLSKLPKYVKEQIEIMKSQVMFNRNKNII